MAENPRIEELRRRVQADPASIVFAALAEEFRRVGRYDEAIETCRTGLQRHPAYLSARVTLGRALIETGEMEAAREELETVLRSAPENLAAIRGLAQIHEKLGQSTEMDPHLADVMKTHAESIRAAAAPPPPPPPVADAPIKMKVAAPEPAVETAPEPRVEPPTLAPTPAEPPTMAPAPEPLGWAVSPETPASTPPKGLAPDPFAGFAPMTARATAPDFSFDLASTARIDPSAASETPFGEAFDMAPEVSSNAFDIAPIPSLEPARLETAETTETMEAMDAIQRPMEPIEFTMEPEEDVTAAPDAGPDPAVLATLARLERFLGAIQSLRA